MERYQKFLEKQEQIKKEKERLAQKQAKLIEENKKTRKPKLAGLLCIPFRN